MKGSWMLLLAGVVGLANGTAQADDTIHWVCYKPSTNQVEYLEVPPAAPPRPAVTQGSIQPVEAEPGKLQPVAAEQLPPVTGPVAAVSCHTPAAAPAGCASGGCNGHCAARQRSLCNWLLYRPSHAPSGFGCTTHPPIYAYFLDHCSTGCAGCQPNDLHGTDPVQPQGCCHSR